MIPTIHLNGTSTEMLDIKTLMPWGEPHEVETSRGLRILRTAPATEAFWQLWRANKPALQQAGISASNRNGAWQVCWWATKTVTPEEVEAKRRAVEASAATDAAIEIPAPDGMTYHGFQKAGVKFSMERFSEGSGGVLIGDEMGLGKTIQAIGIINLDPSIKRVLIVCPCNLRVNWYRELRKWLTRDLVTFIASSDLYPSSADVVIINYDILHKYADRIRQKPWDL